MFLGIRMLAVGIPLFFFTIVSVFCPLQAQAETVVVSKPVVNLRGGPGTGYAMMGQVSLGTRLTVVGKSGDWYKVRLTSGREVWIAGWLVKAAASSAVTQVAPDNSAGTPSVVVVSKPVVNLRGGPGTGYAMMGQVSLGTRLTVVGKSGDWYKVRLTSGREVWIAGWLVKAAA
ncbi:MAG: SH3 domain-containing protein, partial [Bacillota bacterium]